MMTDHFIGVDVRAGSARAGALLATAKHDIGVSAPAEVLCQQFGFTEEAIVDRARTLLNIWSAS
jgi:transketolase